MKYYSLYLTVQKPQVIIEAKQYDLLSRTRCSGICLPSFIAVGAIQDFGFPLDFESCLKRVKEHGIYGLCQPDYVLRAPLTGRATVFLINPESAGGLIPVYGQTEFAIWFQRRLYGLMREHELRLKCFIKKSHPYSKSPFRLMERGFYAYFESFYFWTRRTRAYVLSSTSL